MSDELKQALTANRLSDGEVVFGGEGGWVEKFSQATLYSDRAEADAVLEDAKGQVTTIIDPYLIDISLENGQPVPIALRERVRALGPTIHPDMGKQTEGGPVIEAITAAHGVARSAGRLGLIRRK